MSAKPRLDRVLAILRSHPELQQFGQSNDDWVWDGKTACTHAICQALALIWKGRRLTLNQVNALAGMPHNARDSRGRPRGMNNVELARFIAAVGLPYVIRFGLSFENLLSYSNRGPVLLAVRYGSTPEWRGFRYHGLTADGRPNGYARPSGKAGKTQLSGFEDGRHADLLLGYLPIRNAAGTVIRYDEYRKEPNHGSAARPERPPYDLITTVQGKREYLDYRDRLGNKLYAAIPTQALPV